MTRRLLVLLCLVASLALAACGNTEQERETYQSESAQVAETEPPRLPSDRIMEAIGRRWFKRNQGKALKRLRSILEEGRGRGARATIAAGGPRKPASQFRL